MKYLKPFNENTNNDYYKSISEYEYSELCGRIINIEDETFNKVLGFIGRQNIENGVIGKTYLLTTSNPIYGISIKLEDQMSLLILQLNDEWFITSLGLVGDIFREINLFHKCDQVDGLLKFLKDYNIINKLRKIKPFNESIFKTEDYYMEIQRHEFNNLKMLSIPFTDKEKYILEDKAYDMSYEYNFLELSNNRKAIRFFKREPYQQIDKFTIINAGKNCWYFSFVIHKLEDEWFIVEYCTRPMVVDVTVVNISLYYKCDGIDGVIRCVDDIF